MRSRLLLTLFLSLLFLLMAAAARPGHAIIYAGHYETPAADSIMKATYTYRFTSYCVDALSGEKLPCPFQVSLEGLPCLASDSPADTYCGHVDAAHNPFSRNNLEEAGKLLVLGGLTDAWQQTKKTILPVRTMPPADPVYPYVYHVGDVSGTIFVKAVALSPPDGYRFIAPCESRETCTILRTMDVGVTGLEQLRTPLPLPPPPPWVPGEEPSPDTWDGYVRCGKTDLCTEPVVDTPYNWPAHPQVHSGRYEFLENLIKLGHLWYTNCCQPLVISDISLPQGGLLDTKDDWNIPHKAHRYGIAADISRKSVPLNPTLQCGCGPRPTGGTTDPVWEQTMLRKFAEENRLIPEKGDPGHLKPDRKKKK